MLLMLTQSLNHFAVSANLLCSVHAVCVAKELYNCSTALEVVLAFKAQGRLKRSRYKKLTQSQKTEQEEIIEEAVSNEETWQNMMDWTHGIRKRLRD